MVKFSRSRKYNLKKGSSNKNRYHKTVHKKVDWYDLGYDMASGKKGTGWMKYNKGDIKDSSDYGEKDIEEVADEYTEGWKETEQWQYEVGSKIREELGSEIKDGEINDDYFDAQREWCVGYANYIVKIERAKSR